MVRPILTLGIALALIVLAPLALACHTAARGPAACARPECGPVDQRTACAAAQGLSSAGITASPDLDTPQPAAADRTRVPPHLLAPTAGGRAATTAVATVQPLSSAPLVAQHVLLRT